MSGDFTTGRVGGGKGLVDALPTTSPEEWLGFIADAPCFTAAIDTAVEAGAHWRIIAYAVGRWIAEHRQDELAARIAADFARIEELIGR